MKNKILELTKNMTQCEWLTHVEEFLMDKDSNLNSDTGGHYTVSELVKELKVREQNSKDLNSNIVGLKGLLETLREYDDSEAVKNYMFKKGKDRLILYMNSIESILIGALIIHR